MARLRKGRAEAGGEVRRRLLAGAAELFSNKGYAATTVREIVARAGVTKPALYYYFGSKEGIYLDLMREPIQGFFENIASAMDEAGTARERLVRLCLLAYDDFVRHLSLARLMYSIYYGPPQGAPFIDFDALQLRFQDAVLGILRKGIRAGEFRRGNPTDMMWAVIGAANVAMEAELCRPGQRVGREGLRRMLGVVFRGIAAGPDRAAGRGDGR
ncbi:MAG: TetR/AcrR family transcriptional regulator [Verrucomicrobiota bacterium]